MYNHDRPLSDFQKQIDFLKSNGINPIAVTQMFFDDVFVFETKQESINAYDLTLNEFDGYFYNKEAFLKIVDEYKKRLNIDILIYWLK